MDTKRGGRHEMNSGRDWDARAASLQRRARVAGIVAGILGAAFSTAGAETVGAANEKASAESLLQAARDNRETLPADFPGFRSALVVHSGGRVHRGTMLFRPPITLEIELADKDVRKNVKNTIRSLLSHRMARNASSVRKPSEPARFADTDLHPLGRRIWLGGKYDSSYRIRDERILEVDRTLQDTRLLISVLETETTVSGKYLPTHFFVAVFDKESGAITASSAYRDAYQRIHDAYLPQSRHVIQTAQGQTEALLIEWEAIELLPPSGD